MRSAHRVNFRRPPPPAVEGKKKLTFGEKMLSLPNPKRIKWSLIKTAVTGVSSKADESLGGIGNRNRKCKSKKRGGKNKRAEDV